MDQLIQFIIKHWLLVSAFIVVLILLFVEELRSKGLHGSELSPELAVKMINREDAVVLDIRDANAFKTGHIVSSINIANADLEHNLKRLQKYKTTPIIVVCAAGVSSKKAASKLQKEGFEKVFVLKGGVNAWKNAGMPTVDGK